MIGEYHNHKLQTNTRHLEEESKNNHETLGRKNKQSNHFSLPHQDDCKTRMDKEKRTTKHTTITDSHNGSYSKQRIHNNRATALERTSNVQLAWRLSYYCIVSSWRNTKVKLIHYDQTKKRAHDSQIVRTSIGAAVDPAIDKHQAPTQRLKLYIGAVIGSEAWATIKEETIGIKRDWVLTRHESN